MNPAGETKKTPAAKPAPTTAVRTFDSRELFNDGNTIVIEHAGQRYILRLTRENKLILTK